MSLDDQPVLLLDIQATAAASAGGVLLEVGWWHYPFEGRQPVQGHDVGIYTRLVRQSAIDIPQRLTRLTGLSSDDLRMGCRLADIWEQLQNAAGQVAAARTDGAGICPVVVHYARFEAPYLEKCQALTPARGGVDLDLICTWEIARRLLPGLPRKGLRAVAGYFGHDTPAQRRCSHHLRATAAIWKGLASMLTADHHIATIPALNGWLRRASVPSKPKRIFQVPKASLTRLPHHAGVYRLLSQNGSCLYVGKAKDLHRRVRTYFQPRRCHSEHILEMLSRAFDLKIAPTRSALEAALLEHDLIKALAPPYNIALRPDGAELKFWSRDFQHSASQWSRRHPLGPLPVGESTAILAALVQIFRSAHALDVAGLADLRRALNAVAREDLEKAPLQESLCLFTKTHCTPLNRLPTTRALLLIGRRLWIDRQLTPVSDPQSTEDPTPTALPDEGDGAAAPFQHPEGICRQLENTVCHQAALLRRSRWLALLGNATLTWTPPHSDTQRYLVFSKGRVVARGGPGPLTKPAPEHPTPHHKRWRPTDRDAYDRLRVATTELRRLIHERRAFTIRLANAKTELHHGQVARLLRWF